MPQAYTSHSRALGASFFIRSAFSCLIYLIISSVCFYFCVRLSLIILSRWTLYTCIKLGFLNSSNFRQVSITASKNLWRFLKRKSLAWSRLNTSALLHPNTGRTKNKSPFWCDDHLGNMRTERRKRAVLTRESQKDKWRHWLFLGSKGSKCENGGNYGLS